MKKRNLFLTLGLALTLGAGVAGGLSLNRGEAKEVEANGANHTVYCAISNTTLGSYTLKLNVQLGNTDWNQQDMTQIADDPNYANSSIFTATFADIWGGIKILQFQLYNGGDYVTQDQVFSVDWDTEFAFDNKIHVYGGSGWSTEDYTPATPVSYHTVTQYAVYDGVVDTENPLHVDDKVVDGSTYNKPANPAAQNLKHFDDWYTTAACDVKYTAKAVTADMAIYAKFTSMTVDSYFYWIDKDSSDLTGGRVYFFGEYQNDWATGALLSTFKVSDVLNYNSEGKLYRIPIPSTGNFQVILHNGSVQTYDMTIAAESLVYTKYNHESEGKYYYEYNVNSNGGIAAEFIKKVEAKRVAVTASGSIAQYSLCGVLPSDAAELYEEYESFTGALAAVKNLVDNSYTYTYNKDAKNDTDEEHQMDVKFSFIMAELYKIAMKDNVFASSHSAKVSVFGNTGSSSNGTAVVIILVSAISLVAVASIFVIRRRKEQE